MPGTALGDIYTAVEKADGPLNGACIILRRDRQHITNIYMIVILLSGYFIQSDLVWMVRERRRRT